jgi:hypothetical protein
MNILEAIHSQFRSQAFVAELSRTLFPAAKISPHKPLKSSKFAQTFCPAQTRPPRLLTVTQHCGSVQKPAQKAKPT